MSERRSYVVYDKKRKRHALEFDAFGDDVAKREFSSWYNIVVRPSRWEARKLGRYFLFRVADFEDGKPVFYERPLRLMDDDEVRLSYQYFRACDPPNDEADDREVEAEFDRLDALDAARLARRGNQAA